MVLDDEAAVYHRDKPSDAIWWVRADEFVTESTAVAIDSVVAVESWVDLYPCRTEGTLGRLAPSQGQRIVSRSALVVGCMRVDGIKGCPRSPH